MSLPFLPQSACTWYLVVRWSYFRAWAGNCHVGLEDYLPTISTYCVQMVCIGLCGGFSNFSHGERIVMVGSREGYCGVLREGRLWQRTSKKYLPLAPVHVLGRETTRKKKKKNEHVFGLGIVCRDDDRPVRPALLCPPRKRTHPCRQLGGESMAGGGDRGRKPVPVTWKSTDTPSTA